ncbi:MAG TPA: hypothetical protein VKV20_11495, partial [Ktedonobacteraceae bacterium]|nr:hypothetical protein [Ktedonobacteraceae bacterium]
FLHLAQFFQSLVQGFSHFVIFCSEALNFFLLVHGFQFTKEVKSEHLLQEMVEREMQQRVVRRR